jgi:glycerol-3-phosphate dehydrogenase (NAD(P)+)
MYAIAIGIVSGRYNSPNVDFLVMTKAVGEMRRMLRLYDCDEETIFNYCGLGDLGLTALNDLSRNRTLGLLIGKGFSNDPKSTTVIEGLRTIKLLGELVRKKKLEEEFVVLESLYALLYSGSTLNDYYLSVLA